MSNKNHNLLCNPSPWNHSSSAVWLGSSLTLNRNLEKFKFPGKLDVDRKQQVIALLSQDMKGLDATRKTELFKAEELATLKKEYLVEHYLSMQDFSHAAQGEAFVVDDLGEFLAVFNLKDHLMIQMIDAREELEKSWERLTKIEATINRSVSFAYSPRFGFLTADSTECGTGLVVHIFLHLPGLVYSNKLEEVLEKYKDEGIEQTGLQGDPEVLIGDILVFHNNYTLGLSEETIISSMRNLATKLVVEEKSARTTLQHASEHDVAELKDKVSRAYAILLHSYQIEAVEAMHALSLLKLGLELGWVTGITIEQLNKLFFMTRRAHLLCHYGEKISQEDLPHRRAEYIHHELSGLTLLF